MCWLSEPLPSGLLADAKHRRDLSPGRSVGAGLRDVVGESEIDGSHRKKGRTDGTRVSAVGVGDASASGSRVSSHALASATACSSCSRVRARWVTSGGTGTGFATATHG